MVWRRALFAFFTVLLDDKSHESGIENNMGYFKAGHIHRHILK